MVKPDYLSYSLEEAEDIGLVANLFALSDAKSNKFELNLLKKDQRIKWEVTIDVLMKSSASLVSENSVLLA